jgi:ribokinase
VTATLAVVGSLNQDLVVRVPRLPSPGETVCGSDVERLPGGKGANQAVAAARWGARVRMSGAVGADAAGAELLAALADAGVVTEEVAELADVPTGTALIVIDGEGENVITLAPGANRRFEAGDPGPVDAVLAQLEVPVEQITAVFERARARGARCVLNAAPAPVVDDAVRALLAVTDVVIVNETEAASLLAGVGAGDGAGGGGVGVGVGAGGGGAGSTPAVGMSDLDRARSLLAGGPTLAVLTLGRAGAVAATADATWQQAGFRVRAVDTVGAGDAFCAVFAASLAEDAALPMAEAVPAALRLACAAGALTATRPGAQAAPSRTELEDFLRDHDDSGTDSGADSGANSGADSHADSIADSGA